MATLSDVAQTARDAGIADSNDRLFARIGHSPLPTPHSPLPTPHSATPPLTHH
jgi:hypothetical protein